MLRRLATKERLWSSFLVCQSTHRSTSNFCLKMIKQDKKLDNLCFRTQTHGIWRLRRRLSRSYLEKCPSRLWAWAPHSSRRRLPFLSSRHPQIPGLSRNRLLKLKRKTRQKMSNPKSCSWLSYLPEARPVASTLAAIIKIQKNKSRIKFRL